MLSTPVLEWIRLFLLGTVLLIVFVGSIIIYREVPAICKYTKNIIFSQVLNILFLFFLTNVYCFFFLFVLFWSKELAFTYVIMIIYPIAVPLAIYLLRTLIVVRKNLKLQGENDL